MRLFFALVVYDIYQSYPRQVGSLADQPDPVGLARFFDLSFLGNPELLGALQWVLVIALAVYISGKFLWAALPLITLLVILPGTLALSQGAATHHRQVVALVLLVQTAIVLYRVATERKRAPENTADSDAHHALTHQRELAHGTRQTIAATYLVTAITKMIDSGGSWVRDAKYFPLQLEKTRMSEYYNKLEETASGAGEGLFSILDMPFAVLSQKIEKVFLASPDTCRFFMGCGLLLEFLAPLALLGRAWGTVIGLVLISFHLTISRVMSLNFEHLMLMLLIFFVNVPYLLAAVASRIKAKNS